MSSFFIVLLSIVAIGGIVVESDPSDRIRFQTAAQRLKCQNDQKNFDFASGLSAQKLMQKFNNVDQNDDVEESPFERAQRIEDEEQAKPIQTSLDEDADYNYSGMKSLMQSLYTLPRYICADGLPMYFMNQQAEKEEFLELAVKSMALLDSKESNYKIEVPRGLVGPARDAFLQKLAKFMAYHDVNKSFHDGEQLEQCKLLKEYKTKAEVLDAKLLANLVANKGNNRMSTLLASSFAPAVQEACATIMADAIVQDECVLLQFFQLGASVQELLNKHGKYQSQVYKDMQKLQKKSPLNNNNENASGFYNGYGPAYNAYLDAMSQKVYAQWFSQTVAQMSSDFTAKMSVNNYIKYQQLLANINGWAIKVIETTRV